MALSKTFFSHRVFQCLGLLGFCLLTACDPVTLVLVPSTVVGFAEADERKLGGVASDTAIRTKINCAWLSEEPQLIDQVTMSVIEGRVVLTGTVETPQLKKNAVSLTEKISGVKEVVDEMRVGPGETFRDYSRDSWITAKLKTTLLFDSRIRSRNYSIRTVNRTIYLMGIAQNQQELEWVLEHAKGISGIKRVVDHVRIKPAEATQFTPSSQEESTEGMDDSAAAG